MEGEILKLLGSSVLAAVLFYFLKLLWEKLQKKDEEIAKLNEEIKSIERDNVAALNRLSDAVNGLKELVKLLIKPNQQ